MLNLSQSGFRVVVLVKSLFGHQRANSVFYLLNHDLIIHDWIIREPRRIIGAMLKIYQAPLALGSYSVGVEQGPEVLLREGLLTALKHNGIDAEVFEPIGLSEGSATVDGLRNYHAVVKFNQDLGQQILENTRGDDVALTLGGDHAVGIASMIATKQRHAKTCVVYIDAHPDCSNPKQTLSGNIHGMPLSTALGDALYSKFTGGAWASRHYAYDEVMIIGAKDIDAHEAEYMAEHNITCITMDTVIEQGIAAIYDRVHDWLAGRPLHVALDIDAIDGSEAPGTGIINRGGLTYREVSYLCRHLAHESVVALDLVEVNPTRDQGLKTVRLGTELVLSLLGGEWSAYTGYLQDGGSGEREK